MTTHHETFREHSMFLCEHKALGKFAQKYVDTLRSEKKNREQWSVICERKEDIISVRNQIFYEIEKRTSQNLNAIAHISMFTLDSLGRNFCATLSHVTHSELLGSIPKSLSKPYLEVHLQEKCVELILHLFGYTGTDSSALSKQILTLLDTPLPQDTNLVELVLSTQIQEHKHRPIQEIHTNSLKQILATFQQAKIELAHYARFQSLTLEYLNEAFFDQLQNKTLREQLVLPSAFLKSNILWIEAPQYQDTKPGHFQRSLVDEFKNAIVKAKEYSCSETHSFFYESKTILNSNDNENSPHSEHNHIRFLFSENEQDFFHRTKELASANTQNALALLADFDPNEHFFKIRADGGGTQALIRKDIEQWKLWRTEKNNTLPKHLCETMKEIDALFDQFISVVSLINCEENLHEIGKLYGLSTKKINEQTAYELFVFFATKEKIKRGAPHPASLLPKALSFFQSSALPSQIVAIGRAHAPVTSSFNVKILNNTILLLKEKGADIELPASDIMYKEFWKSLVHSHIPMEFWLASKSDLEEFPRYLTPQKNRAPLNFPLAEVPPSLLAQAYKKNELVIPHWQSAFLWKENQISVTQFETYVSCPLQFFLSHILHIQKTNQSEFDVSSRDVGTRMHQICEQLVTRLVTLFGNAGYVEHMAPVLKNIISVLKTESIFLSFEKDIFKQEIQKAIHQLSLEQEQEVTSAFFEALETLWKEARDPLKPHLVHIQEREILKRCFLKFLQIELLGIESGTKMKVGIAREFPISFDIQNLRLHGKIDRVDAGVHGCEIIDYKTSKIPRTEKELVLLPSAAKNDPNSRLSAQGALYSYGWSKCDHLDAQFEEHSQARVSHFSLYRLKNLDDSANAILHFYFSPTLVKKNDFYKELEKEYEMYAQSLLDGNFLPRPLQGNNTCTLCPHTIVCPFYTQQNKMENSLGEEP